MNKELDTETIPVSCMNGLRYGNVWPTDPILFEINAKLDKLLALLDKD